MSQSEIPLDVLAVAEPRLELNNKRTWVVVKGGQTVTYYPFPSTSFSNNQFNFITNPPSASTVLDRLVFIQVPVTLTFTPSVANPPVNNILQPGEDAFRAFPISSITNTLTATINGFPVNIELSEIIHALSRYHTCLEVKNGWMSMQPSFEDNYQSYQDSLGANNNPLGSYLDAAGLSEIGRGAYPMTVVSNTPAGAVINAVLYEQVFLPPFLWDGQEAGGLANLTSLTFNWVLSNNLQRIWSHSPATDVGGNSTIGGLTVAFAQPVMYLGFITPRLNVPIPPKITYPYFQISRYTTQFQQTLAPNASATFKSNIIQLDSIPRKIYCFMKQSNSLIYQSLSNMIVQPDVFLQINNLNVTWNNNQGLLSGASPQNLYDFSKQNGYNKTWTEFNGITQTLNGAVGNLTKVIGLEGGIVCLEMAKDIGLRDNESEGVLGNFNLQIQLTCTNVNQYVTYQPDMYIIAVYDGTLVISNTSAIASIGVVTPQEVLDAPISNAISYNELQMIYGGTFFGTLKDIGNKILSGLKGVNSFLKDSKIISTVAPFIPLPGASAIGNVAKNLGYGYDAGTDGYVQRSGARMNCAMDRQMMSGQGVLAGNYCQDMGQGVLAGDGVLYGGKRLRKSALAKKLKM